MDKLTKRITKYMYLERINGSLDDSARDMKIYVQLFFDFLARKKNQESIYVLRIVLSTTAIVRAAS